MQQLNRHSPKLMNRSTTDGRTWCTANSGFPSTSHNATSTDKIQYSNAWNWKEKSFWAISTISHAKIQLKHWKKTITSLHNLRDTAPLHQTNKILGPKIPLEKAFYFPMTKISRALRMPAVSQDGKAKVNGPPPLMAPPEIPAPLVSLANTEPNNLLPVHCNPYKYHNMCYIACSQKVWKANKNTS